MNSRNDSLMNGVGEETNLRYDVMDDAGRVYERTSVRKVVMFISGPRGWLRLFEPEEQPASYGPHIEAIKTFMELNNR